MIASASPRLHTSRQQALVRLVDGVVVGAEDEGAEAAVVLRRHDLHHLDAVRLDGELLVALEHFADGVAVDDEHGAERRLKDLRLPPNLLQHRIGLALEEEPDDGADRPALTERLDLQRL